MFKKIRFIFLLSFGLAINAQIPAVDWIYTFGGKATEAIIASDMDSQGNIINVGVFRDTTDFDQGPGVDQRISFPGKVQMFIQKIDAQGNHMWVKTFGSNGLSSLNNVKVASDGSIYCSGYFEAALFDFNPDPNVAYTLSRGLYNRAMFLLKLDASGNFGWALAQGGDDVQHTGIAVDNNGNLYATGVFNSPFDSDPDPNVVSTKYHFNYPNNTSTNDVFVQRIDATGNQLWLKAVKSANDVSSYDIAIDMNLQPVIVGYFVGSVDFDPGSALHIENSSGTTKSAFILKLDTTGGFINVQRTTGTGMARYERILFDDNFNIYLTGHYSGNPDFNTGAGVANPHAANKEGYFLQKNSPNGNFSWVHTYENPINSLFGNLIRAAVDSNQNIYTAGSFRGATLNLSPTDPNGLVFNNSGLNSMDMFIVKHDSVGNVLWGHQFGATTTDYLFGLMLDQKSNIAISGYYNSTQSFGPYSNATRPNNGLTDSFILKFSDCPPPLDTTIVIEACEYHDINLGNRIYSDTLLIDTLAGSGVCDSAIVKSYIRFQHQPAFVSYDQGVLRWDSTNIARYQLTWISCDLGDTAGHGPTFTPIQNGNYALIVDKNGCTDTSSCISVKDIGVSELTSLDNISAYPNPVKDILFVEVANSGGFYLRLFNVAGKEILVSLGTNEIDMSKLPEGVYLLRIEEDGISTVKKIIKD